MSLSIEAEKYRGKMWLLIRQWDGVGQPDRTPICEISEEELDFAGGRFEKMGNHYTDKFKHKIGIDIKRGTYNPDSAITWIYENTKNNWCFDIVNGFIDGNEYYENAWVFYFEKDEDAVAFKLRWK